ncbi:MAG TPA: 2-dehydropantoate 2-reductase [Candidatus Acidoferrum sp.]|nr:2-dehydropantoate 2-reductase [Candidatus Acidoferrum sp.]
MKIAVLGLGGVGGFVGGALTRVNKDTYFCVRGANQKAIRENGLRVDSKLLGSFTAHPAMAEEDALKIGAADALIIACKGNALKDACATAAPMVGEHTLVLPLLNGLLVSELMEGLLPPCDLADGIIHIFSHIEGPGHVVQEAGSCTVKMGMRGGGPRPPAMVELARILNDAGVPALLPDDIAFESWMKFTLMCGNSVIFGLYDGPAGVVRADPGHEEVCRAVWQELTGVASAMGMALPADLADRYFAEFEANPPGTVSSLYRDLRDGKPPERTELSHIVGRLVTLGRQCGVATPLHEKMFEKFGGRL